MWKVLLILALILLPPAVSFCWRAEPVAACPCNYRHDPPHTECTCQPGKCQCDLVAPLCWCPHPGPNCRLAVKEKRK